MTTEPDTERFATGVLVIGVTYSPGGEIARPDRGRAAGDRGAGSGHAGARDRGTLARMTCHG